MKTAYQSIEGCKLPVFISLDLGLRQRQKNMHGQIFFQAVVVPDSYFVERRTELKMVDNESLLSENLGIVIAEGGRFDDLVSSFINRVQ